MKRQKEDLEMKQYKPVLIGAGLIIVAILAGILVNVLSSPKNVEPEPTPEPAAAVTVSPPPTPTPTPTPTVTAIRLYSFGRELDAGGITLYVGDKPVELSAVIEPADAKLPVGWTFSDQESASLDVSSDGMTCKITALKPTGRNDLTVICNNLYTSIPVYLWEK